MSNQKDFLYHQVYNLRDYVVLSRQTYLSDYHYSLNLAQNHELPTKGLEHRNLDIVLSNGKDITSS